MVDLSGIPSFLSVGRLGPLQMSKTDFSTHRSKNHRDEGRTYTKVAVGQKCQVPKKTIGKRKKHINKTIQNLWSPFGWHLFHTNTKVESLSLVPSHSDGSPRLDGVIDMADGCSGATRGVSEGGI